MSLILALDQGTTSSRAILFDQSGSVVGISQSEFAQHFPHPGWVEHDAQEIWRTQLDVAREVLENHNYSARDIEAIGITNQRETTLIWDRSTGEPVHPAIVWQDRRTAPLCESLVEAGHQELIQSKTGLRIDPYFCASKIRWLLDNVEGLREKANRGELAFGTIDSWLIWNLTGGKVHATDITNASRTMLVNVATADWDKELLALLEIPQKILPKILPSSYIFGETEADHFGSPIRIGGVAGDQQSALFGQNCLQPGMAKSTYGTGCFMLLNIGEQPRLSSNQLLTTICCGRGKELNYALEGSVFIAGAAIQWLRDGLGIIQSPDEVEKLASTVDDTDGVYFVPAFAGLGTPHWNPYARGTIVGLTRGTSRAHIVRATLESIAFQVADVFDAMKQDANLHLEELRVDGGATANDLLMQFQADILQVPVVRPKVIETTALGAAFLAGLATGFWKNVDELSAAWQAEKVFRPAMSIEEVAVRRSRWSDALDRSLDWESSSI